MAWTDERTEKLKKLWGEGHSASVCAAKLGDVTRNAVIAKVHRLGLSGRTTVVRKPPPGWPKARSREQRKRRPTGPEFRRVPTVPPEPVGGPAALNPHRTLQTLEPNECRWPHGEVGKPEFHFCGQPRVPGAPYCSFHFDISRAAPAKKKKKEKPSHRPYNPTRSDIKEFEDA